MIKSNYEDTLNFICNNEFRQNIFKDKLNLILTHINDYYQMCDSINKKRNELNHNFINANDNNKINNFKSANFLMNNNYGMYMNRNNNKINLFKSNYNKDNNIEVQNYGQSGGYNRYDNNFFD